VTAPVAVAFATVLALAPLPTAGQEACEQTLS
jgi:hypothetical protein